MEPVWYGVHFSLNGSYEVEANTPQEAEQIAEDILKNKLPNLEGITRTKLSIEVYETTLTEEGNK